MIYSSAKAVIPGQMNAIIPTMIPAVPCKRNSHQRFSRLSERTVETIVHTPSSSV